MARDTAFFTPRPPHAAPPSPAGRGARVRASGRRAAVLGFVLGLLAAAVSALPRPGLPRGDWMAVQAEPPMAEGAVAVRYRASPVHRWLMGDGYRELWTTPIRAGVIDVQHGGYRPVRTSGGRQTRGLRLRGADGREYAFRSLDKDQSRALHPLLRLLMGRARQDQVSALHPGAALVAAGLQDAGGVTSPVPRLAVMPTPMPGEYEDFAGLVGTLQEFPRAGFRGAERVVDTDSLWAELRRRPNDRVNTGAYLRARLMDVYMGDWDRHEGQLRWARFVRADTGSWLVIPRDRDYAFSHYGGVIPGLARRVDPKIVRFDTAYRDLHGLLVKSRELDARLLCGVPAPQWDSAAAELVSSLDDLAISAAIHRMPRDWIARAAPLEATLRARRDRIPQAARRFRQHLHAGGGCTQSR